MGLFSDADVNEVGSLVEHENPPLDREAKLLFLQGFYEGWKHAKETKTPEHDEKEYGVEHLGIFSYISPLVTGATWKPSFA